jgi:hypothetical protein
VLYDAAALRLADRAGSALMRGLARAANLLGSVSLAIRASNIARPVVPLMLEITWSSLMFASSSGAAGSETPLMELQQTCSQVVVDLWHNPGCSGSTCRAMTALQA